MLLIDEADVFLEQRSLHDVQRNSMVRGAASFLLPRTTLICESYHPQVSVFLRLLEYHSGILVLTTNRIRTVDPAFLSRFSIALTYPDLDHASRSVIWRTFLERAGARIERRASSSKLNGILPTPANSGTTSPVEVEGSVISAQYLDRLASKATFNGRRVFYPAY